MPRHATMTLSVIEHDRAHLVTPCGKWLLVYAQAEYLGPYAMVLSMDHRVGLALHLRPCLASTRLRATIHQTSLGDVTPQQAMALLQMARAPSVLLRAAAPLVMLCAGVQ